MGFLHHNSFIFLLLFALNPKNSDQTVTCGNNTFLIQHPFRLLQEGQEPRHKSHHDHQFILKCNLQGFVVLNLPSSGDFYVQDIDYFYKKIQIYDPGNCLAGRMKNLSLSSSPYVAETYQNYTFISCPAESLMTGYYRNFTVISCLSNSSVSVVATSLPAIADGIKNLTGCGVIYSGWVSSSSFVYDSGFNGSLVLAWNDPSCNGECKGRSTGYSVISIIIISFVLVSIAALGSLFCIGCCLLLARKIAEINDSNTQRSHSSNTRVWQVPRVALPLRPRPSAPSATAAMEDKSATEEVIIGGRQCISGPNSDSCSICLEEYEASDRLRLICICQHCFHADCLDKWLERESTCPICRTTVT